jgi:chromosome segregation ATPase
MNHDNIDGTSAVPVAAQVSSSVSRSDTFSVNITGRGGPDVLAPIITPMTSSANVTTTAATSSTFAPKTYGPPPPRTFEDLNEDLNVSTARLIETSEILADLRDRMVALELNNNDLRRENNKVYEETRITRSELGSLRDQLSSTQRQSEKTGREHKSDIERLTADIAEEREAATRFHQLYHDADSAGAALMETTTKLKKQKKRATKKLNKYRKAAKSATRRADKAEKKLLRAEMTASLTQFMATIRQTH